MISVTIPTLDYSVDASIILLLDSFIVLTLKKNGNIQTS